MEATETILCRGHPLISARHRTTFEITTEHDLTRAGDCIIGICADKGARDLSPGFRQLACRNDASLTTILSCGGVTVTVRAQGSTALTLDHPTDLVWRRSRFTCGRTIGIESDTVAADLPDELILHLSRGEEMFVTMTVTCPG